MKSERILSKPVRQKGDPEEDQLPDSKPGSDAEQCCDLRVTRMSEEEAVGGTPTDPKPAPHGAPSHEWAGGQPDLSKTSVPHSSKSRRCHRLKRGQWKNTKRSLCLH